jgi:Flp pilus assembly protein TadG
MRVAPSRILARLRRFRHSEDGSIIVFGLFMFMVMLIIGGIAVDVMRYESRRVRLQTTLDRAILAAADLDQNYSGARTAQAVVEDYFRTAGFDEMPQVRATGSFNSRTVTATAEIRMPTIFMDYLGVPRLDAPAGGAANETVRDIEVVLVLDVSGSMVANGTTRMANLRVAAKNFISTVLTNDEQNRISIAIVPFNGQVNLGPTPTQPGQTTLASWYTEITDRVPGNYGQTFSHVGCVDLPGGVYGTQTIARSQVMPATQLVDTFTSTRLTDAYHHYASSWNGSTFGGPQPSNMWCPPSDGLGNSTARNVVLLPSQSIPTLQSHIDGLVAVGATSINAGMRWGMTMLDPASRGMFTTLGVGLPDRPYDFNRDNTLKVIVLMTDGENFPEERVNDGFRSGPSRIWRSTNSDGNYSIFHPSRVNTSNSGAGRDANIAASRPFWVPHLSRWQARPWNGFEPDPAMPYVVETAPFKHVDPTSLKRTDRDGDNDCDNDDDGFGPLRLDEACWFDATEQTWPLVWTNLRMSWVAWQLYARALTLSTGLTGSDRNALYTAQMNLFRTRTGAASGNTPLMDDQLKQMCDRARAQNIQVYGIALEAPPHGQTLISACATSVSDYVNATSSDLDDVFHGIAVEIAALRLVR